MRGAVSWTAAILLAGLFLGSALPAQEPPQCIQQFEAGTINWTTGQVLARGGAGPEKQQDGTLIPMPGSARAKATANAIEILKQIQITPDLTVGEYAAAHDIILAEIEKIAQEAETIRQVYTSALDIEVWVSSSILGGVLQLVLPEHIRQIPIISDQAPRPAKKETAPDPVPKINRIPQTGLIIDARGLSLPLILYPVIISEEGKELYSSLFISREFAVQHGVCTYVCDMDAAVSLPRIGANPLVFKALRREGSKTGGIVISMADAKIMEKAMERHQFLKECRVVIVTDP